MARKKSEEENEGGLGAIKMRVRLTINEEALGTSSANKQLHRDYIASKAPDAKKTEEEVAALGVDAVDEKGRTVFPRMTVGDDTDVPFLYDYQMKGFFKDAAKMLKKMRGSECSKVRAYKQAIDGLIFIDQRKIPWLAEDGTPAHVGPTCERPLRASTPMGERVALASSETVPAGSHLEFGIILLDKTLLPMVKECLDYGQLRGLGQWRNSGKGTFTWERVGKLECFGSDE
jgi:hypothetical protein